LLRNTWGLRGSHPNYSDKRNQEPGTQKDDAREREAVSEANGVRVGTESDRRLYDPFGILRIRSRRRSQKTNPPFMKTIAKKEEPTTTAIGRDRPFNRLPPSSRKGRPYRRSPA
jgi:hypothetical protein